MSGGTIKPNEKSVAELESLFGEAVAHFQAGRLKEAEGELAELQRRQPDLPEVLHLMALIELQTGRTEAAAGHLEKAVAWQPLYRTAVERWKHYQKHLWPLIDALNPN